MQLPEKGPKSGPKTISQKVLAQILTIPTAQAQAQAQAGRKAARGDWLGFGCPTLSSRQESRSRQGWREDLVSFYKERAATAPAEVEAGVGGLETLFKVPVTLLSYAVRTERFHPPRERGGRR